MAPKPIRWLALTSSADRIPALRALGATPLIGNLDQPSSLRRLAGIATRLVHLAPPPGEGWTDPRVAQLVHALRRRSAPRSMVYASTSGVYGDCAGAWVAETRATAAQTPRAQRRVHAEQVVRVWGRASRVVASILRIPGIYAADREGGTPRARLAKGTPVLIAQDDVYTNHIHANDLARASWLALWRGRPQRIYNIADDSELKMGDYFDMAADLYGMPRPPRVARDSAPEHLPVMLLSFMSESRRLHNQRMKRELRLALHYRDVAQGLLA